MIQRLTKPWLALALLAGCASAASAQKLLENGVWTWFNAPQAEVYGDDLYFGSHADDGNPIIGKYNLLTGADTVVGHPVVTSTLQVDDHNNPAIIRLISGKWLACFSEHNADSFSATTTSTDMRTWNTHVVTNSTEDDAYAQIMQADDNSDTCYWFFRRRDTGEHRPQYFRTSTDEGATWNSPVQFFDVSANRPYFRFWKTSSTRFDFAVCNGQPEETVNSLYHGYILIDATDGSREYYKSDGTLIGDDTDLPLGTADCTQVYDGTTSECWILDLKVIDGQPTVLFTVFPSHGTNSHEYWRGRFNGSTWTTEKIADAGTTGSVDYLYAGGGETYSGGGCLDPLDEDVAYLSLEYGGVGDHRLEKWVKSGSWAKTVDISGDTNSDNCRPVAVAHDGTTYVLYWSGTYTTYTDFDTDIHIYPTPSFRTAKATTPTLDAPYLFPGTQAYFPLQEGSGTPVDLTTNYTATTVGTPTWGSDSLGQYVTSFSTSNHYTLDTLAAAWGSAAYPKWIAVVTENTDTTATQYPVLLADSADNDTLGGIVFNVGSTGTVIYQIRGDSGSSGNCSAASQPCNDGNTHVWVGYSGAVNAHALWVDGVQVATSTTNIGTISPNTGTIGCLRRASAANPFLGQVKAVAFGWGAGNRMRPQDINDDWPTGRFSGAGPAPSSGAPAARIYYEQMQNN